MDDLYLWKISAIIFIATVISVPLIPMLILTVSHPTPSTIVCVVWGDGTTAIIKTKVPIVVNGTATEKFIVENADIIQFLMNATYIYKGKEYKAVDYRFINSDLCDEKMIIYLEPVP